MMDDKNNELSERITQIGSKSIRELFEFQKQYAKKYRGRIQEFDPQIIWYFCFEKSESTYNKYKRMRGTPDRITIFRVDNPIYCSPTFLEQCAVQIQKQIEEKVGYEHINRLDPWSKRPPIELIVFTSIVFSKDECRFCYKENHNGTNYLYFLSTMFMNHSHDSLEYQVRFVDLWIRCSSTLDRSKYVDPEKDVLPGDIKFEICSELPDSLPQKSDLPDCIQLLAENRFGKSYHRIDWVCNDFRKRFYDPNSWLAELKTYIAAADKVLKRRKKREKKTCGSQNAEVRFAADDGYYPDVTFTVEFNDAISDDKADELYDSVSAFDETLKRCNLEYYSADKTGDCTCEITVDFGMCHPKTVLKLIKAVCSDIEGIKTITVG